MDFCPFHKENCKEVEMITIIELKKGKIKQTKICQNCISSYLGTVSLVDSIPESIEEIVSLFLEDRSPVEECASCTEMNTNEEYLSQEQKIKILQNKLAAAIKVEDYETAAVIKKQINTIKDLN
jgi:protein-arginine kinase activator protein McsA